MFEKTFTSIEFVFRAERVCGNMHSKLEFVDATLKLFQLIIFFQQTLSLTTLYISPSQFLYSAFFVAKFLQHKFSSKFL